jgi:hypothetical protein
MLRVLLYYVLPFLLPFVGFFTYRYLLTDGRALLQNTPWFVLTTAGLALVVVSLFTIAFTGGWDVEGDYRPPRFEDGRIVPGEVRVPAGEVIEEPVDAPPGPDAIPADGN